MLSKDRTYITLRNKLDVSNEMDMNCFSLFCALKFTCTMRLRALRSIYDTYISMYKKTSSMWELHPHD